MAARKAVEVIQAEATEEVATVKVTFRDVELEIPASIDEWPLEAMEAFEREQLAVTCSELLGPVQWRTLKPLRLKVRDLNELLEACFSQVGVTSGN